MTEATAISPSEARARLNAGGEMAFLDVREHGQYGEGHPFFCVNLPYSRLELDAEPLLPRRDVPLLLLDNGDEVAERAARRLAGLGYSDVSLVAGGAPAWAAAGYTLFKGVNVPSKTFGELVEHEMGTPSLTAAELRSRLEAGENLVVLDGRSPEEFRKMNLPGAASCPNAELGHRLPRIAPDPATTVVVNCAGRTRSIIGAQSLRNQGVANSVLALENGTQGWRLAGYELQRGSAPSALPDLGPEETERSRDQGRNLIARFNLPTVSAETLGKWRRDTARSLYIFDVRTREEYAAGSLAGAVWAPGGQLVQAADQWVGIRGARIVLVDDTGLRAAHTALWLRAMGHDATILDQDVLTCQTATPSEPAPESKLPDIAPVDLASRLNAGALLIDLSPSTAHRSAHPAGAVWATRARLAHAVAALAEDREIILADRDRGTASLAAVDLAELGFKQVSRLTGGPEAWHAAGLEVVESPDTPEAEDCIDFLFFVHDRHDDNLEASRQYLAWETGLLAQLAEDERAVFRMPSARGIGM